MPLLTYRDERTIGLAVIYRVTRRLMMQYLVLKHGEGWFWKNDGARDGYYLLCTLWGLKRKG